MSLLLWLRWQKIRETIARWLQASKKRNCSSEDRLSNLLSLKLLYFLRFFSTLLWEETASSRSLFLTDVSLLFPESICYVAAALTAVAAFALLLYRSCYWIFRSSLQRRSVLLSSPLQLPPLFSQWWTSSDAAAAPLRIYPFSAYLSLALSLSLLVRTSFLNSCCRCVSREGVIVHFLFLSHSPCLIAALPRGS